MTLAGQQTARSAAILLLAVLMAAPLAEAKKEALVSLSASSFEDQVLRGKGWAFVKFFAPWCQHCSEMGPAWAEVAEYFQKNPVPGIVNKNGGTSSALTW